MPCSIRVPEEKSYMILPEIEEEEEEGQKLSLTSLLLGDCMGSRPPVDQEYQAIVQERHQIVIFIGCNQLHTIIL
jgi:hypothetical protein